MIKVSSCIVALMCVLVAILAPSPTKAAINTRDLSDVEWSWGIYTSPVSIYCYDMIKKYPDPNPFQLFGCILSGIPLSECNYMVGSQKYLGSGVLIADDIVLTSARTLTDRAKEKNCYMDPTNSDNYFRFDVGYGSNRISLHEKTGKAKQIVFHPDFDEKLGPNSYKRMADLAIIKLRHSIKAKKASPMMLPWVENHLYSDNYTYYSLGWGDLGKYHTPKVTENLQVSEMDGISHTACLELLNESETEELKLSPFGCTQARDTGPDKGDIGSPVYQIMHRNEEYFYFPVLRGIVSDYRVVNDTRNRLVIYTDVHEFSPWIKKFL